MEKKEETKKEVENKEKTNKVEAKKNEQVKEEKKVEEAKKETKEAEKKEETKKETLEVKKAETPKKQTTVKVEAKKATTKKDNNKKANNKIIPIIVAIVAIAVIACVGYFIAVNLMKTEALKEIEAVFNAMKSGDKDAIKQYLDGEDTSEDNQETDESGEEMAKIMLSQLNYEVVSTDANLKECNVKLKITNKDLKTVFSNYMQKAFTIAISQAFGKTTEEMNKQLEQYFEEQYNSESVETVSTELAIKMTKKDGKWNMDANEDEVLNAILPGYQEILKTISSMGQ